MPHAGSQQSDQLDTKSSKPAFIRIEIRIMDMDIDPLLGALWVLKDRLTNHIDWRDLTNLALVSPQFGSIIKKKCSPYAGRVVDITLPEESSYQPVDRTFWLPRHIQKLFVDLNEDLVTDDVISWLETFVKDHLAQNAAVALRVSEYLDDSVEAFRSICTCLARHVTHLVLQDHLELDLSDAAWFLDQIPHFTNLTSLAVWECLHVEELLTKIPNPGGVRWLQITMKQLYNPWKLTSALARYENLETLTLRCNGRLSGNQQMGILFSLLSKWTHLKRLILHHSRATLHEDFIDEEDFLVPPMEVDEDDVSDDEPDDGGGEMLIAEVNCFPLSQLLTLCPRLEELVFDAHYVPKLNLTDATKFGSVRRLVLTNPRDVADIPEVLTSFPGLQSFELRLNPALEGFSRTRFFTALRGLVFKIKQDVSGYRQRVTCWPRSVSLQLDLHAVILQTDAVDGGQYLNTADLEVLVEFFYYTFLLQDPVPLSLTITNSRPRQEILSLGLVTCFILDHLFPTDKPAKIKLQHLTIYKSLLPVLRQELMFVTQVRQLLAKSLTHIAVQPDEVPPCEESFRWLPAGGLDVDHLPSGVVYEKL